jgi:uncharacterized protein HemY
MQLMGKTLLLFGVVIAAVGLALMFFDKIPLIGKLPGDINIKKDNFRLTVPVTSSILLSILVSGVFWLISHFKGR